MFNSIFLKNGKNGLINNQYFVRFKGWIRKIIKKISSRTNNTRRCFFDQMMKKQAYSMEQLAEIINNKDFVTNYNALKNNIIKVNPIFVLGTLKIFDFEIL